MKKTLFICSNLIFRNFKVNSFHPTVGDNHFAAPWTTGTVAISPKKSTKNIKINNRKPVLFCLHNYCCFPTFGTTRRTLPLRKVVRHRSAFDCCLCCRAFLAPHKSKQKMAVKRVWWGRQMAVGNSSLDSGTATQNTHRFIPWALLLLLLLCCCDAAARCSVVECTRFCIWD